MDGGRRRVLALGLGGLVSLAVAAPARDAGVDGGSLRLATIVAPGVDAARRQVFVAMLEAAVAGRAGNARRWQLEVWELQGAPETWRTQLESQHRQMPVFAVLSGLSDSVWAPVHDFCEATALPCWFPSVPLPDASAGDVWSAYFSRGVALEADVLASHILGGRTARPARLVQIHRDDALGRGAAAALRRNCAGSSIALESRAWAPGDLRALTRALRGFALEDAAVLWMARGDLPLLAELPPPAGAVYLSAQLAGGEKGLPVAWRRRARLVYPFELPAARAAYLEHLRAWLRAARLPLIDEVMQAQVLFAADSFAHTVAGMGPDPDRDRLRQRARELVGGPAREVGGTARRPTPPGFARSASAAGAATAGRPRAEPGPVQPYATRGAYIVRFADPRGEALVAESGWIVP